YDDPRSSSGNKRRAAIPGTELFRPRDQILNPFLASNFLLYPTDLTGYVGTIHRGEEATPARSSDNSTQIAGEQRSARLERLDPGKSTSVSAVCSLRLGCSLQPHPECSRHHYDPGSPARLTQDSLLFADSGSGKLHRIVASRFGGV